MTDNYQTINDQSKLINGYAAEKLIREIGPYLNQHEHIFGKFAYHLKWDGKFENCEFLAKIDNATYSYQNLQLLFEDLQEAGKITVDDIGIIRWFDKIGQLHRKNGRAYYSLRDAHYQSFYFYHGKRTSHINEHMENIKSAILNKEIAFRDKIWNLLEPYFSKYSEYFSDTNKSTQFIDNKILSYNQKVRGVDVSLKDLILLYEDLLFSYLQNFQKGGLCEWIWANKKNNSFHRLNGLAYSSNANTENAYWLNGMYYTDINSYQRERAKIPQSPEIQVLLNELELIINSSTTTPDIKTEITSITAATTNINDGKNNTNTITNLISNDKILDHLIQLKDSLQLLDGQDSTFRNEIALKLNEIIFKFNEIQIEQINKENAQIVDQSLGAKQENIPQLKLTEQAEQEDKAKKEIWIQLTQYFCKYKDYFYTTYFRKQVGKPGSYYIRGKELSLEELINWENDLKESQPIHSIYSLARTRWHDTFGRLHRLYGPAVEFADGSYQYFFEGTFYLDIKNNEQWAERVKQLLALKSQSSNKTEINQIDTLQKDIKNISDRLKKVNDQISDFNRHIEVDIDKLKAYVSKAKSSKQEEQLSFISSESKIPSIADTKQLINHQTDTGLAIGQEGTALHIPDDEIDLDDIPGSISVIEQTPASMIKPSQFQQDLTSAGYRIATLQISKLIKETILQAFPKERLSAFTAFLNTELGTGFVALMAGWIMTAAISDNSPRVQKLSDEFRIQGLTIFGNEALEMFLTEIVSTIKTNLPNEEEKNVEFTHSNGIEEETEQENDRYSSTNSKL